MAEKIIIVNCDITEKETIRRIRKRNRNRYDVDKMSDEELEKILKLEKENIVKIRKIFGDRNFTTINLNTEKTTIAENVNEIVKIIDKKRIEG